MMDQVMQAQMSLSANELENEQNPNNTLFSTGGGEGISKPLRLEPSMIILLAAIVTLLILIAFTLGFMLGKSQSGSASVERSSIPNRAQLIEQKNTPRVRSSVMKIPPPSVLRQRKENEQYEQTLRAMMQRDHTSDSGTFAI